MVGFDEQTLDVLNEVRLDPYNPRLRKDEEGLSQEALIAVMLERFKIEEVADSILAAGWLEQDPLIAVVENGETRVVEGNRRMTAVKLLLDPSLAPTNRQARWHALSTSLANHTRTAIQRLTFRVYPSRDDPAVSSYIGFRHVTGVLPWPAMEKASYIARLASRGTSYQEVAEKLGSYPRHMIRHHVAFQLVEQADHWEIDGSKQMGESFGVLLRALQTDGVPTFIGAEASDDPAANANPIKEEKKADFADFVKWTFGTETRVRVLPESRELTRWGKILQSPAAVRYLRNTEEPKFGRAWALSGGESESIADSIWKAAYLLADVIPLISDHTDDDSIRDAVKELNRYMRQINATFPTEGQ